MNNDDLEEEMDEKTQPKPTSNFSKYHKPDDVLRPGRLDRGETKYIGNSSMAPRKTPKYRKKSLRDHKK